MRRLLIGVALWPLLAGCWASTTKVEPVGDKHVRYEVGPPQPHLRKTTVSFRQDDEALSLIVVRQQMCAAREIRRSRDKIHTKVEASPKRWVPAAVLGGLAAMTVVGHELGNDDNKDDDREATYLSSAVLVGLAAAYVAIPSLAEREHTRYGEMHERSVPARERPCGQFPLPNARVVLRTGVGTQAAMTDRDGVARFPGLSSDQVETVFVEDVVVTPQSL